MHILRITTVIAGPAMNDDGPNPPAMGLAA